MDTTALMKPDEAQNLALVFHKSGLFADIAGQTEDVAEAQAIVKIIAGNEMGLEPFYSMQNLSVIKGHVFISAQARGRLLKQSGKYRYGVTVSNDTICTLSFKEKVDGAWEDLGEVSYTIEEAKRAGLVREGGGYYKNPGDMLFARALSRGSRRFAPELFGGIYAIEEADIVVGEPDIPEDIKALPAEEKQPPKKAPKKAEKKGETNTPAQPHTEGGKEAVSDEIEGQVDPVSDDATPEVPGKTYSTEVKSVTKEQLDDIGVLMANKVDLKAMAAPHREEHPELWPQSSKASDMSEYMAAVLIHQSAGGDPADIRAA
jgi:hypothetical protein